MRRGGRRKNPARDDTNGQRAKPGVVRASLCGGDDGKETFTMASTSVEVPRPTGASTNGHSLAASESRDVAAAAHQAFWLLRIAFTVAPILFGIDKFTNWSVHWPDYLAGWINNIVPGTGQEF